MKLSCLCLHCAALCLAMMSLARPANALQSQPLSLQNGATVYGGQWAPPVAHQDGRVVILEGLVKLARGSSHVFAALPPGLRPDQRLVFHTNLNGGPARVDIFPDGRVLWSSGVAQGWISLDGVAFSLDTGAALALAPGHAPYPNQRRPSLQIARGLGMLSGVVRLAPGQTTVATLPNACRPKAKLGFTVAGETASEVVAHPDGRLVRTAGSGDWLSLAGVNLACAGPGRAQRLHTRAAADGFHSPHAARVLTDARVVVLAGAVQDSASKPIVTLSDDMRVPGVRLLHRVVNGRSTRVHLANGVVIREGGAQPGRRIDLSGLVFVTGRPRAPREAIAAADVRAALTTQWLGDAKILDVHPDDGRAWLVEDVTPGAAVRIRRIAPDTYTLREGLRGNCLGVRNAGDRNRPRWTRCANVAGQRWVATAMSGGFIRLTNRWRGDALCLDVINDAVRRELRLAPCGPYAGQLWKLNPIEARQAAAPVPAPPSEAPVPAPGNKKAMRMATQLSAALADVHGTDLIRGVLEQDASKFRESAEGSNTTFSASTQVGGASVTLVMYVPPNEGGSNHASELAVIVRDVSAAAFISGLKGTVAEDFAIERGVLFFVPSRNARALTANSRLPETVRTALWGAPGGYHWPTVELRPGANALGKLAWRFTPADGDVVRQLNALLCQDTNNCGQSLFVQAAATNRPDACNQKGWRVRVHWPHPWDGMIDGVRFENSNLELAPDTFGQPLPPRVLSQTAVRVWSDNATLGGHRYFVYAHCVKERCKAQNSFAIGADRLTLQQARDIIGRAGGSPIEDPLGGLAAIELRHPTPGYTPSDSVNAATGDPKLDTANGYFVGIGQRLAYAKEGCLVGVKGRFEGTARVFGLDAGRMRVDYESSGEGEAFEGTAQIGTGHLALSPPLTKGADLTLRVRRDARRQAVNLDASVGFEGVGTVSGVSLALGRSGSSWSRQGVCPAQPFALEVETGADLRDPKAWYVTAKPALDLGCYQRLLMDRLEQAGAVAVSASGDAHNVMLAIAEFGDAGIGLAYEAAQNGWRDFGSRMQSKATQLGRELSDGAKTALGLVTSAGGSNWNPTNWKWESP